MSKYFEKEQEKKFLLSAHVEEVVKDDTHYFSEHMKQNAMEEIKYLIKCLGDVEMSKSMMEVFCSCFHSFGGKYDVKYEKETIQGLYDMTVLYPELTAKAIDEIKGIYIQDLFQIYSLKESLGTFIEKYGKTDECFDTYCAYVDQLGTQLQKEYEEKAKMLEEYIGEYDEKFIGYLQNLVVRKHYDINKIISCLPSADLIKKDAKQLLDLAMFYRIHFGAGYPVSYTMTKDLVKNGNVDDYPEIPTYYISTANKEIPALFTKQEYLDSIKKRKSK